MSFKESLEAHPVTYAVSLVIATTVITWTVAEAIRVTPKTEKIADLERRNSELLQGTKDQSMAVEPNQRELAKLLTNNKQLEVQLRDTQGRLEQLKIDLESWQTAYVELQSNLKRHDTNCTIIGQINQIEYKKESVERGIGFTGGNSTREEEQRRIASEYQTRLLQLQSKLLCQPSG